MFAPAPIVTTPPAISASCADPAPPAPLDLTALSKGLPDGVYFAGQRLAPWMSFVDRSRLSGLEHRGLRTERHETTYRALRRQREGESIVVRWEIEGGLASTGTELWDVRKPDMDHDGQRYAYLWGKANHVDVYRFGHRLIEESIDLRGNRSSNTYIDRVMQLVEALPSGDVWVLPAHRIVQIAAEVDLLAATTTYRRALVAAQAAGVDTLALLALAPDPPSANPAP